MEKRNVHESLHVRARKRNVRTHERIHDLVYIDMTAM